ncbi:hypothetical protein HHK36_025393 [Tetracentron sinense]|uniref:VWFA domain-containing protein n=1 Tax=Tetracentron sinense TaxID=13715 RepID=A0A835D302_TETSI|nr:hypothetical protein HHK36_025393 [Tetracentron sinense]
MAEEFAKAVEDGLKLAKRIYFGKDRSLSAPKSVAMEKATQSYLPTAPMVYAVISDPAIVDNPDIPSYQPHVHGRCDPPALIPLQMNGIGVEADCYLDTAFVTISGSWRVHCVMRSRSCDCRIAIPMGEQGSILGVEVDVARRSYCTQLITMEDKTDIEKVAQSQDGSFLEPQIFILTIPQVDGGSNLSIKVSWSQKLLYHNGQFSISVPYSFPDYVTPAGKVIPKREKIQLNVNSGTGTEVLCRTTSHPLKELRRQVGKLGFLYEAEVLTWSKTDFNFSYTVKLQTIVIVIVYFLKLLLKIQNRFLQVTYSVACSCNLHLCMTLIRERCSASIFFLEITRVGRSVDISLVPVSMMSSVHQNYHLFIKLSPSASICLIGFHHSDGSDNDFRKQVVFIVDISGSMQGRPLENAKNALSAALSKLNPQDFFSIIAFNGETYLFSSSMELATEETIENAIQWIDIKFVAEGGTNILLPLNQAIEMLSNNCNSIPLIFLITDGSVEDERHICDVMRSHMTDRGSICPRISTFGIGSYCNHYFLQLLALIGRGYYDAAYDADSIDVGMERLFATASSAILANITIDALEHLDALEVYPFHIPDLLSGSPLTVSGRYQGTFPDSLKARGILADMSNFALDLKVQNAKDIPLEKVFAKQQIALLTAQAWFSESKQLEEKVAKMSIQTGVPSEYTRMVLLQTDRGKQASESAGIQEVSAKIDLQKLIDSKGGKMILLRSLGVGFGNLIATTENIPLRSEEAKLPEPTEIFIKAASNCCGKLCNCCCCMYCIQACSRMNDQCSLVVMQLCSALACFGIISCCSDVCCD